MYTKENVARKIKSMGVPSFVEMVSDPYFSQEIKDDLEKIHVFRPGYPCISAIQALATL